MFLRLFFIFSFLLSTSSCIAKEKAKQMIEFVIVIPSYNNEKWCIKNLDSVVNQTYPHITYLYINDCSKDNTGQLVEAYVKEKNLTDRFKVIHNETRKGAMANIYNAVQSIEPHKVVAVVDGDDWLRDEYVIEKLARLYQDGTIWITHGNYTSDPFTKESYCKAYSKEVQKKLKFRKTRWYGCQLRTFYAKLFHLIKKEDLMLDGQFLPATYDLAIMFPMLEMASKGHIHFVKEPIYVVNTANPISDNKEKKELQKRLDNHLRGLQPYLPLPTLF
jgi:glycosyltransferase involved in cell wall biosynthesis